MLSEGFHAVPPGHLATIVTHLETRPRVVADPIIWPEGLSLTRAISMPPDAYRQLFRKVGEDWLWVSRLRLADDALREVLENPLTELWVLRRGETDLGLCELDFRDAPDTGELAFFGLAAELQGQGVAQKLMAHALHRAATKPVVRFTVHTCTLDHPAALPFYRKSGFVPVRQEVELMRDPRLEGLIATSAAPHIPIISA